MYYKFNYLNPKTIFCSIIFIIMYLDISFNIEASVIRFNYQGSLIFLILKATNKYTFFMGHNKNIGNIYFFGEKYIIISNLVCLSSQLLGH